MTGAGLRAWRRRHGLTQAQAAECLGIQAVTVSQYERGVRRTPNTVALLCAAYDDLFGVGVKVIDAHAHLERKNAETNS
ncbi:hypothetical protein UAM5_00009 [Ralstonia phage UAM5]|nr:hypothetical protein UAM5_00009 [Ralstonia phage UAM5]